MYWKILNKFFALKERKYPIGEILGKNLHIKFIRKCFSPNKILKNLLTCWRWGHTNHQDPTQSSKVLALHKEQCNKTGINSCSQVLRLVSSETNHATEEFTKILPAVWCSFNVPLPLHKISSFYSSDMAVNRSGVLIDKMT